MSVASSSWDIKRAAAVYICIPHPANQAALTGMFIFPLLPVYVFRQTVRKPPPPEQPAIVLRHLSINIYSQMLLLILFTQTVISEIGSALKATASKITGQQNHSGNRPDFLNMDRLIATFAIPMRKIRPPPYVPQPVG